MNEFYTTLRGDTMSQWTNNRPVYPNELYHYGVMGMKWGIRNYQPYPSDYKGTGVYKGKTPRHSGSKKIEYGSKKDVNAYKRSLKREQRGLLNNAQYSAYLANRLSKQNDRVQARFQKKYGMSAKDMINKQASTNHVRTPGKAIHGYEKRLMRDSAKATDAQRNANFWKTQSKTDLAKQKSHAKAVNKVYGDLKMKTYDTEERARKAYLTNAIIARTMGTVGGIGIGIATGRPVLGGLMGSSAMNSMNPDIYRSSREYSQRYNPNLAKTIYKNTINADKAYAKMERQEMARKNYLR